MTKIRVPFVKRLLLRVFLGAALFSVPAWAQAPVIDSLSAQPSGLSRALAQVGGKQFTLTVNGQNFVSGSQVFAGSTGLTTTFVSSSQLTAVFPKSLSAAAAAITIKVTNPGAQDSNTQTLNVIERGDFNANRTVNIGDALVAALSVGGVVTPAIPTDVGDINFSGSVNIGDALSIALYAGRIEPNMRKPTITSVSASPVARGGSLSLTGSGFSTNLADNVIVWPVDGNVTRVNLLDAPGATVSSTTMTVTVPNTAVSGLVEVLRLDIPVGSNTFPLMVSGTTTPVLLSSVTPAHLVLPGGSVELSGLGFSTTPSSNTVSFRTLTGRANGTVTAATAGSITVTVPPDAICGDVLVTVGSQTSNARAIVVTGTTCPVLLTDIFASGAVGDVVVIEGTGFDVTRPQSNIVKFATASGTATATVVQSGATELHVVIPTGAVQGNVTVEVGSQTSNAIQYKPLTGSGPGPAATVTLVSTHNAGTVNTQQTFSVRVADSGGTPVSNTSVAFAKTAGNGVVSAASATTDANGLASVTITLGTTAGTNGFSATVTGLTAVSISVTGNAGSAVQLNAVSGNNQTGSVSTALTEKLIVQALDQFNNPVASVSVTFALSSGVGGSVSPSGSQNTDANGRVEVTATLGAAAGAYQFTATAGSLSVAFNATAVSSGGQANVTLASTHNAATVNTQQTFTVRVADSGGTPVANTSVAFAKTAGNGIVSAASGTTDANGLASVTITLGTTAGSNTYTATVAGLTAVTLTVTGNPGPAVQLNVFSGNGQLASVSAQLPQKLVAQALDAFNNPIGSLAVTFAVTSGTGASVTPTTSQNTDSNGRVEVTATLGPALNTYRFAATAGSLSTVFNASAVTAGNIYYVATTGNDTSGTGSSASPWKTIGFGISRLAAGDALVVKNGVYTSKSDFIVNPPSGTASAYTVVMAETPMEVRIQSAAALAYSENMLKVSGNYIKIDGFIFDMANTTDPPHTGVITGTFNKLTRSIFKRSGNINEFGGLLYVGGNNNLIEDVAGAGACRYCFEAAGPDASTQRVIWRRVVGRMDYANSKQPKATFATYGNNDNLNVKDHLYQNILSIDGHNPGNLGGGQEKYGAMYLPKNANNIRVQGSIVLNEGVGYTGMFNREWGTDNSITHTVIWDLNGSNAGATGLKASTADRVTVGGNVPGAGTDLQVTETNSRVKVSGNPTNLLNNTPGAVVLKRYGVSGTLWGETGYDQLTNEDLWPWPYEDKIKAVFAETNTPPTGNSPTTNNTQRGFAAPGNGLYGGPITLTSYIWEYTGTALPAGTYPSSTSAPAVTQVSTNNTATVGAQQTFTVLVTGAGGIVWPYVPVTFAKTGGNGSVSATTATTGADGRASVTITLGTTAGLNTYTATVAGVNPATLSVIGNAGTATQLNVVSGNNQSYVISAQLQQKLVVQLLDVHNNPVSGAAVTFTVTSGSGASVSPTGAQNSDTNGRVEVNATMGPNAGNYQFTATAGSLSAVFTASAAVPIRNTYYVSTTGNDTTGTGTSANPWKTIGYGISRLSGGDILIVKNGVYTALSNFIAGPPTGSPAAYTEIKAETPMEVRIQSTTALNYFDNMLKLTGNYIKVDGFIFDMANTTDPPHIGTVTGTYNKITRSIFKRSGNINEYGGLLYVGGNDTLIEDVAGVGACRYCFEAGGPDASTQRVIWRRVVGRMDYSNSKQPKATFATYGNNDTLNVKDHLYQNIIAIDGQNPGNFGTGQEKYGAMYLPKNANNVRVVGSIVLNEGVGYTGMFNREWGTGNSVTHSVVWDLNGSNSGVTGVTASSGDRLTIGGNVPGNGTDLTAAATNSRIKVAGNPTNLLNNTPGAVILKRYGVSGTLWGETGYDQLTTEDLWPWPYEDKIKAVFAETNTPPSGNSPTTNNTLRGFAAAGNGLYGGARTLTSYIWEYTGTAMPSTFPQAMNADPWKPSELNAALAGSSVSPIRADARPLSASTSFFAMQRQNCDSPSVLCVDDAAGATREFATIQAAAEAARAGDTILVHEGKYAGFQVTQSGTKTSPIVFRANGPDVVINRNGPTGDGIRLQNVSYVTIDGFYIEGVSQRCIAARGATADSPMKSNAIRNITCTNAGVECLYLSQFSESVVERNVLKGCGASGASKSHGIYLANAGSDDTIIRGNSISKGPSPESEGIHINGDVSVGGDGIISGLTIEQNRVHDMAVNALSMDGVQNSLIRNNLFYGNGRHALRAYRGDGAAGPSGLRIVNNTFHGARGWAIKLSDHRGGNVIFNNVLVGSSGSICADDSNLTSNNNAVVGGFSFDGERAIVDLAAWQKATGSDSDSIAMSSSGLFSDVDGGDYRLSRSSIAIDKGRASLSGISAPVMDLAGTSRPRGGAYDIGAYENLQ